MIVKIFKGTGLKMLIGINHSLIMIYHNIFVCCIICYMLIHFMLAFELCFDIIIFVYYRQSRVIGFNCYLQGLAFNYCNLYYLWLLIIDIHLWLLIKY